jgi:hypothetical protein
LHPDNTKKENVYPQSPDGAPKGQKLLAQGIALWYYAQRDLFALNGQKHFYIRTLPIRGALLDKCGKLIDPKLN